MPNALVTGSGSGIGQAIAARLVKDGFRVWVSDLDPLRAEEVGRALGMPHLALDVTNRKALEEAAEQVFVNDGRLDVLVANAGVSTMNPFLKLSEEEWDFNFTVNTKGTFLTLQTFARRMAQQPLMTGRELRGKLIATASMAARQAAPLLAHYSASKFAVLGLVQAAAKELAPLRLTVNAVNPGFVQTSMQEREVAWEARLRGMSAEAVLEDYVRQTPLGRLQRPEDVAAAIAFLAGPDADFITGEALEVNGGAWIF
ncbi:SDR family oxidoreductase [Meiothermus sp. CFH 77666]|uniref:SDR family NAD(P)-dependent oxidoreductase n=1 Tax=Meiothermus sp. CFH 77666 TaxID=2817942 RepID=UPI001AA04782|nr:SDR family oxidoreductase [Meiothermus sp. CFH 77666]MBO1438713.1 SDR family oxidoreductase [Meiothermus sp. CFH 77666]